MTIPRLPRTVRWTVAVLLGTAVLVACTMVASPRDGGESVPPALLDPPPTLDLPTAEAMPETLPVTSWGGTGHDLAVVVANDTGATITQAQVTIVGLDAADQPVTLSSGTPGDPCCSIIGVPSEGQFGLFAHLERPVDDLDGVEVRIDSVSLEADEPGDRVDVEAATLDLVADDAVVTATLRPRGAVGPYVVGQAVLVDEGDRPVGVISGRFYCFEDRDRRDVRMELLRPAPTGTSIGQVMAYPIPADVSPGAVAGSCES